jgi:hypothetical protein
MKVDLVVRAPHALTMAGDGVGYQADVALDYKPAALRGAAVSRCCRTARQLPAAARTFCAGDREFANRLHTNGSITA